MDRTVPTANDNGWPCQECGGLSGHMLWCSKMRMPYATDRPDPAVKTKAPRRKPLRVPRLKNSVSKKTGRILSPRKARAIKPNSRKFKGKAVALEEVAKRLTPLIQMLESQGSHQAHYSPGLLNEWAARLKNHLREWAEQDTAGRDTS